MFIKLIVLVALIRLLIATEKPFLCSGIYAGIVLLFGLAFGQNISATLLSTAIAFGLSSLYFWLLDHFDSSTVLWWIVVVAGILIGLV